LLLLVLVFTLTLLLVCKLLLTLVWISVLLLPRTPTPNNIPRIRPSKPSKPKIPQHMFLHGLGLIYATLKVLVLWAVATWYVYRISVWCMGLFRTWTCEVETTGGTAVSYLLTYWTVAGWLVTTSDLHDIYIED
jgi:hypothetical protein